METQVLLMMMMMNQVELPWQRKLLQGGFVFAALSYVRFTNNYHVYVNVMSLFCLN